MTKKKDNRIWIVLGILAFLLLFWYLASQGYFKSTITVVPTSTITQLENPPIQPPGITCTLSLSKSVITAGDLITGTIIDGKNAYCEGYGKMVGTTEWRKISEGTTDLTGRATYSENFWVEGDFVFAAICDTNGNGFLDVNDCVTNQVPLKVNPAPSIDCTDSDGINKMTPGWVIADGIYYYDSCVDDVVTEYYCDGSGVNTRVLPCDLGYECIFTRSGAYCALIDDWNVGDIVSSESGSGTMPESGGVGFEFHDLTDFEVVPGGPRRLGARIQTSWDYVNQEMCFGMVQQEGMEWMFMDSDSVEWHVVDNFPQAHSVDLCPLDWDGTNLWFLDFWKTQNILGCDITYSWDVEIYVCE